MGHLPPHFKIGESRATFHEIYFSFHVFGMKHFGKLQCHSISTSLLYTFQTVHDELKISIFMNFFPAAKFFVSCCFNAGQCVSTGGDNMSRAFSMRKNFNAVFFREM